MDDILIYIEVDGERPDDELIRQAADHARAILEEGGHDVRASYELKP